MSKALVRNYYASFGEREWQRLTTPEGVIEWAVTTHILRKHLPSGGRILDIGGGVGRYSIWLAQQGYTVTLGDLSPELIAIAKNKIAEADVHMESVDIADVCDLARWVDASFDALLCLGPFYHLVDEQDRAKAAAELVRVLKPGGTIFVAFMPIYGFFRRTLAVKDEQHHLADTDFVSRLLKDGIFLNDVPGRFNAGYGVYPQAIAPFFEQYGLTALDLVSDMGFASGQVEALAELAEQNPAAYEAALEVIIQTANDPGILGMSGHLVYVGKKLHLT